MNIKQKVLIVDDETRSQRIAAEILEDWSELKTVSTGEEALSIVGTYFPDLILLDIMMSGIDGYEVCKRIKANPEFSKIKIILVSGKATLDEKLKGYDVGADDYITKPFMPEELLAKAKVFLRLTWVEKQLSELNCFLDEKIQERTDQLFKAKSKLMNSAKMSALGEMAGGIAHEINTPLCTIGLMADQIQALIDEDPVNRKVISKMTQELCENINRISTIIQGLKTFSRDGSNDRFESVSLQQIIENTLILCQEKLKFNNIQVHMTLLSDHCRIQCQPVQISQVLLNLINNACDVVVTLKEKWIKISVEKQEKYIHISITDSGNGISEDTRNKLFQPFFTTKETGHGTGLGLSISKGILDSHSGSLSLDTQCENTRFVIKLPLDANHDASI